MKNAEYWLARTFVDLADTLVDDFDVIDLLTTLSERCTLLLEAKDVGLMATDLSGALRLVTASSERMELLELFELQVDEGPCLQAVHSGAAVLNVVLADARTTWPKLAPRALQHGFRMAHAFPMRLRNEVIGAVNVFHDDIHILSAEQAGLAQALTDAATISVIQDRALRHATDVAEQLQSALDSRVAIEQAKGILAARLQIDVDSAFGLVRAVARSQNTKISDLARRVAGPAPRMDEDLIAAFRLAAQKRSD